MSIDTSADHYKRDSQTAITGLIIAAGLSSRMGAFKPLMDYCGKSFVVNIAEKLDAICKSIIIVTGYNSRMIGEDLEKNFRSNSDKIILVHNPDYKYGMFSSIKKGLDSLSDIDWILYHMVDQPNLALEFYTDFISQIDYGVDWIQPTYKERKGHPILFNNRIMEHIKNAKYNSTLREISNSGSIRKKYCISASSAILTDIDTPEDFEKLKGE